MEPEQGKWYRLTYTKPVRISATKFSTARSFPIESDDMIYGGKHRMTGKCLVCGRRSSSEVRVFVDMVNGGEKYITDHCWKRVSFKEIPEQTVIEGGSE